jgi:peroxiredoxin
MAATETIQIPLGYKAPEFLLPDVLSGESKSFAQLKGDRGTVVVFMCNHCPYVIHILDKMVEIAANYKSHGIHFIGISANDVEKYPQDSPELMKVLTLEKKFSFPYLYDESQDVARAYDAACTPDFSVFDANDICVYRGQFDGARYKNDVPVTGEALIEALNALLGKNEIPKEQRPSLGCNIKWKA